MKQWHQRLQEALDRKGWKRPQLASASGVSIDKLNKYAQGRVAAPRGDTIQRLAAALDVSVHWLAYGVTGDGAGSGSQSENLLPLSRLPVVPLAQVAKYFNSRAGVALPEHWVEHIDVPRQYGPRSIGVRADDDSMAPKIPRGAVVVCDPDASPEPGRYVVILNTRTNEAKIRRFRLLEAGKDLCELIPENTDYPKSRVHLAKDGLMIGRVVWIMIPV